MRTIVLKRRIAAIARASGFIVALLGASVVLMGAYYPPGLSDGSANPARALVSGIYSGGDAGGCCWLGAHAVWKIAPPAEAATAIVTIFVPNYAVYAHAVESFRLRVDGAAPVTACCYGPGIHQFPIALPAHKGGQVLTVVADATRSFVPEAIGIGADTRVLSVLLRGIEFRAADGTTIAPSLEDRTTQVAWLAFDALIAIVVFVLARRRPIFGLAALLVVAPLGTDVPVWHTTVGPFKTALVGLLAGLAMLPAWRDFTRDRRALWLLGGILALALAAAISVLDATYREPVARETLKMLEYALAFVVAYVAMRADPDERLARNAFAATTAIVCVCAIAQEFVGAPEGTFVRGIEIARIGGPLEGPNQLAAWLGLVAPVSLVYFAQLRWYGGLAIATTLLTLSRGGVLGMVAAIAAVFARSARLRASSAIAGVVALALAAVVALRLGAQHPAGEIDTFNGGLGTRADLWHAAWAMFRAHPLTGVGAGNYELLLGRYGLLGIRTHANSWYFQGAAEGGIVMLLAIAFTVVATLVAFARSRNGFALAAFAATAGICIHQIVDDLIFYPKVGAMWWMLLGVAAASLRLQETADSRIESVPASASSVAGTPTGSTH